MIGAVEPGEHAAAPARRGTPRAGWAGVAFVLGAIAALALLAWPRPTPPRPPPGLHVPAADVREARAEDRRLATAAPGDAAVDELRRHERAQARLEGRSAPQDEQGRVQRDVLRALAAVVRAHGDGAIDALRAQATDRFEAALDGDVPESDREWVLGQFAAVVAKYGAMTPEGQPRAPRLVLRTLYEARWNVAHGLAPTHGLSPPKLRAYHGWLAFEVRDAPPEQRLVALDAFVAAGGEEPPGARAALLAMAGRHAEAADAYAAAYEATGSLRFRNHALHCVEAAAR